MHRLIALALVLLHMSGIGLTQATAAHGVQALQVFCYSREVPEGFPVSAPCLRIALLFPDTTIARAADEIPADLDGFDVVAINRGDDALYNALTGRLNPYVQAGGGLVAIMPSLSAETQPFPAGFEVTVTSEFWPGFPIQEPPAVEFTGEGASHPMLVGLTPADLAATISTVPISALGSAWTVLATSVGHPHAALAVGSAGAGRIVLNLAAGSDDENGARFARQILEWAAQKNAPTPTPDPTPGPDIQIDAIEVTQAIQDLSNSVDLIAGKRTYVRVHVSAPERVADVAANLSARRDGPALTPILRPGNPGGDITIAADPDRGQLDDSFWFELPIDWIGTGPLTLTATLDPDESVADSNRTNNEKRVTVNFLDAPPFRLRIYNVHYRIDGTSYRADTFHLENAESWLRRAYPISDLRVRRAPFIYPLEGLPELRPLLAWLGKARLLTNLLSVGPDVPYHYGMVGDSGGTLSAGWAESIPGHIAVGPAGPTGADAPLLTRWDRDGSYGDYLLGHEIAHLIGRFHANFCGVGENNFVAPYPYRLGRISPTTRGAHAIYGYDTENVRIYGPNWRDIMTYCDFRWVSDFTYEGIRQELAKADAAATPATNVDRFLLISSIVDLTRSTAELLDIQLIPQAATLPLPQAGDWTIALLDATEQELATYSIAPRGVGERPEDDDDTALIVEAVPWIDGTAIVELRDGAQVVASRHAGANAPTVTITAPEPGAVFDGESVDFSWTAEDADGDDLTYSVLYSPDGGENWEVLTTNLATSSFTIDAKRLPGGQTSYLRILAADGFLTGADSVGPFSVPVSSPTVVIGTPHAEGRRFYAGQLVTLQGSGYDGEDGPLTGASLSWSSDLDGDLGIGSIVQTADLAVGEHTVTLRATDSTGSVGQAQRTLSIAAATDAEPDQLAIAPVGYSVITQIGETAKYSATFTLRNRGAARLDWTANSSVEWLSLSRTTGVTPAAFTVTVDATGLTAGRYESAVTVAAGNATSTTLSVPVTLTVAERTPAGPVRIFLPFMSQFGR